MSCLEVVAVFEVEIMLTLEVVAGELDKNHLTGCSG